MAHSIPLSFFDGISALFQLASSTKKADTALQRLAASQAIYSDSQKLGYIRYLSASTRAILAERIAAAPLDAYRPIAQLLAKTTTNNSAHAIIEKLRILICEKLTTGSFAEGDQKLTILINERRKIRLAELGAKKKLALKELSQTENEISKNTARHLALEQLIFHLDGYKQQVELEKACIQQVRTHTLTPEQQREVKQQLLNAQEKITQHLIEIHKLKENGNVRKELKKVQKAIEDLEKQKNRLKKALVKISEEEKMNSP